jgi:hypothetical protein
MTNTNCLKNIKCPDCGNEDRFRIQGMTLFTVTDDGTDEFGDVEWDDDSYAECVACHRHGTLKDFMVTTQPTAIMERNLAMTTEANAHTLKEAIWAIRDDMFWQDDSTGVTITALPMIDRLLDAPVITAVPAMLEALLLAQRALNTAPRFRIGDTDSYKIAAIVDNAIAKATNAWREP